MGVLPVATLRALLQGFEGLGLDTARLLAAAKVTRRQLEALEGALPVDTFGVVWAEAMRQVPRETLPTELGFAVPFGAFGAIDFLASSSATVQAAFESLQAHFRHVGAVRLELEALPHGAVVGLTNTTEYQGRLISDEMTLALLVSRFRLKAHQGFVPRRVRLTRAAPANPADHERLFGAPIDFGCGQASLELDAHTWARTLPDADVALQTTLRQLAVQLGLGPSGEDELLPALRARLRAALPAGDADAAHMARSLGCSERTLHRKLTELNTSWREVLEAFREHEAERLLSRGMAFTDVALQLGFSDQTAWNRAFRRWKGVSPSEWLTARGQR